MEINRFETSSRMSKAVIHGNTAYLCGQTAAGIDITEQTEVMLGKVDEILASIGSDKTKVLSATIYVKDMVDFAGMNAVWDKWVVEGFQPSRACVEAKMCRDEILVEISVVAAV